jgi:putative DNA primase/helicase
MTTALLERLSDLGADVTRLDATRIGVWQRLEAGKSGSRPIAVKIHRIDPLLATVGDWRQGDFVTVCDDRPLSREERARLRVESRRAHRAEEQRRRIRQAAARAVALQNLRESSPARADHPYLVKKGVKPHGVFEWLFGDLLIPMFDRRGALWSHQTIRADGTKLYLKDGRRQGTFFQIGEAPTELLAFAEGYATAASIHEGTDWPVAVCFDAHGIGSVAAELRRKFARALFVFAADDDAHLARNVGLEAARDAARNVGGLVVSPRFASGDGGTDWNDFAAHYGLDAVRDALTGAVWKHRHG